MDYSLEYVLKSIRNRVDSQDLSVLDLLSIASFCLDLAKEEL